MQLILLFPLLGLYAAVSLAFNVPQDWIIGLREGHTLEEHFALVRKPADIKQYIPEINGYAIANFEDDDETLSSIRQDRGVGFVIQKPRGFFSKDGHVGLEGDDLTDYEVERMWLTLQDQDPEVIVTDDDATKIPLTWRIFFTDKSAMEEHLSTVGKSLHVSYVYSRSYCPVFDDQTHEKRFLSLVKSDSRVSAVYPERTRQGIFYDEVEGNHPKPYTADHTIIHEV